MFLYPAGQTVPAGSPANAFAQDRLGQCVDVAGNVLDANGVVLGPGNSPHTGAAMCGSPVPGPEQPATSTQTPAPTPAPPQSLPSGLPTGPIQQSGSSVSSGAILLVLGAVTFVGLLSYYLTRSAPPPEPEPVRAARVARRRSGRKS